MTKRYFITYHDNISALRLLSNSERGRLYLALLEYSMKDENPQYENPILDGNEKYMFEIMKVQIDRDNEKYKVTCERNKQNIKKRWGEDDSIPPNTTVFEKYDSIRSYTNDTNTNTNKNKKTNKESVTNVTPKKITQKNIYELFDCFWQAYPKKIAKQAAVKAFRQIPDIEATLAKILEGVKKWAKSEQWLKDDGKFIPNPATFLNGKRWEDEIQDICAQNKELDDGLRRPSYDIEEYEKSSIFGD